MWFKVDDKLHDHRKTRVAGKSAMGLWVLAGSWSGDNMTDGFIPESILRRWGNRADAARLVTAGLWRIDDLDGEQGWRFHDWFTFQPSAASTAAVKSKESDAGLRGNHRRWHRGRGVTDPDCEYCYRVPDQEPDRDPDRGSLGVPDSGSDRPEPEPEPGSSPTEELLVRDAKIGDGGREDVEQVCGLLADQVGTNTGKRPTITSRWRTDARLMLDRDGRTVEDACALIAWATTDPFWRSNILSMPKFREKYDQLRLKAIQPAPQRKGEIDWGAAMDRAVNGVRVFDFTDSQQTNNIKEIDQ